jgi:hypothetical protein
VKLAATAEPSVLMRKLLWSHKLSKAIIYCYLVILKQILVLSLCSLLRVAFRVLLGPDHVLKKSPALVSIEGDFQFEFKVVSLLFLRGSVK